MNIRPTGIHAQKSAAPAKSLVNRVFSTLESRLWPFRVSWSKTLYFNLRSMPFRVAVKLPVYIYSHTQFSSLSGRVELVGRPRRGMVRIGKREDRGQGVTNIRNMGRLVFHDGVTIMQGCDLYVGPEGVLDIGAGARIRENVFIYASRSVRIGARTGIAYQTTISDDDFHYVIDAETGAAGNCKAAISIGARNWIGSRTVIKKGTVTPDDLIVASSYSLLSKDYTASVPPFSVIGGLPARLLKSNVRRVFNQASEAAIHRHYAACDDTFVLDLGTRAVEAFCLREGKEVDSHG
jgi:acetyltransferase-like isoleucine patch superfamily enzyme